MFNESGKEKKPFPRVSVQSEYEGHKGAEIQYRDLLPPLPSKSRRYRTPLATHHVTRQSGFGNPSKKPTTSGSAIMMDISQALRCPSPPASLIREEGSADPTVSMDLQEALDSPPDGSSRRPRWSAASMDMFEALSEPPKGGGESDTGSSQTIDMMQALATEPPVGSTIDLTRALSMTPPPAPLRSLSVDSNSTSHSSTPSVRSRKLSMPKAWIDTFGDYEINRSPSSPTASAFGARIGNWRKERRDPVWSSNLTRLYEAAEAQL